VAFSGIYAINANEIGPFGDRCAITLVDHVTGIQHDLRANPNYTFTIHAGDPIDRFAIVFNADQSSSSAIFLGVDQFDSATSSLSFTNESQVRIFSDEGEILVEVPHHHQTLLIHIFDLSGKTITQENIANPTTQIKIRARQREIYIISLLLDGELHTQNIYVQ
jgi:hypothetical protein